MDGSHHDILCTLSILFGTRDDVLRRVLLDLLSADGRIGASDARIEQPQIFVYLRRRAYGRARIARDDLLFDGDSGRYAFDEVTLRLVHAPQELTCIAREALHITALSFGIERIESQRRLAAARHASYDHQFVAWYLDVNILQVVDSGSFYFYVVTHQALLFPSGVE